VPFVRVSRDKRGYQHIYLFELFEVSSRRPSRPRILYWFRTPPGVRVGREPFDEPMRRVLEAQNPGVTFDWKKLVSDALQPAPDVENWRERRRAEREAKRVRRGDEEETAAGAGGDDVQVLDVSPGEMPGDHLPTETVATVGLASGSPLKPVDVGGAGEGNLFGRRRRRHRGGRHRQPTQRPDISVTSPVQNPRAEQADKSRTTEAAEGPSGVSLPMSPVSDTAKTTADSSEEKVSADSAEEKE
jgi:hypothetical protein